MTDVRRIPGTWHVEYNYSIGKTASDFFDGLEGKKVLGGRCASCERVSVPPKSFCEFDFVDITDLVEVDLVGTVETATVVTAPFKGGQETPYCVAYVKLDGASTSVANYIRGLQLDETGRIPEEARIGARVRAVFAEKPTGRITDFWFEPLVGESE